MTDTIIWIRGVPKGISLVKVKNILLKYVKGVKSIKCVKSNSITATKNDFQKTIETKLSSNSGLLQLWY